MKENIFQMEIDKDEQSGKFIIGDSKFDMIKEEDSDSWLIILENETKN